MKYQFATADDAIFVLDVVSMRWGRVSSILASPSIKAVESEAFTYNLLEEGDLIPMGGGVYNMDGRDFKDKDRPGAGLVSVGLLQIAYDAPERVDNFYIRANVMLKEDSFTSSRGNGCEHHKMKYHIIQANRPVPSSIVQMPEPPTVEEAAQPKE